MKAQILDSPSTGHYSFHFYPEDASEEFFLNLLIKEDGEIFSPIHHEDDQIGVGVLVPKRYKREINVEEFLPVDIAIIADHQSADRKAKDLIRDGVEKVLILKTYHLIRGNKQIEPWSVRIGAGSLAEGIKR